MKICLAFMFCLFMKAVSYKTMYLSGKHSLIDVMATASAQASAVAKAPKYSVSGATASASASASSLINSRKSLLPTYSSIKADVDKKIADAKARMEQRRKEIFGKGYHSKLNCYDLKDDKCYDIDAYEHCGYCVTQKYPVCKGYGMEYYEEHTVIKPKGECHGEFVYAGDYCPSCEKALQCLIVCSEVDVEKSEKSGVLEIKESCFDECGVTEKDLIACGYVDPPKPPAKKVPVVVHPPTHKKTPVVVHPPSAKKNHPPAKATASAYASATAVAGGH